MRLIADVNLPCGGHDLRMALEAKIVVPLDEHLVRDRAVRLMTNRAAFPQGLVPINELAPITIRVGSGSSTSMLLNSSVNAGTTFHRIRVMTPPAMRTTAMG